MSRKLIFLTLGILFLFALAVQATETRVATMGNNGAYLKDDAGIFMFPGTMAMYPKMIIAEHFSNTDVAAVGPFDYGRFRRVGIIFPGLLHGTWAIFAGGGQESFTVGGGGITVPTSRFLLGYGTNTGNSSLGFQFDFSGVRTEVPAVTPGTPQATGATVFTASTWGIAAGLSGTMGDLNNFDLGFRMRIGKFENMDDTATANATTDKSDGNTTLSFVARDYYALNDYVNLVPVGKFGVSTQKDIDLTGDTARFKNTQTMMELGLGIQTKPSENSEVIGGVGYRSNKTRAREFTHGFAGGADSVDFEASNTNFPFAFLGFEAQVKNWMHFRLGVEKSININKAEVKGPPGLLETNPKLNESKQSSSPLAYAVGVGMHAGPVTMDALVANTFFNDGPNFLSGRTTAGPMFPRISFAYNFK